jgi:hypothetical protein
MCNIIVVYSLAFNTALSLQNIFGNVLCHCQILLGCLLCFVLLVVPVCVVWVELCPVARVRFCSGLPCGFSTVLQTRARPLKTTQQQI